MLHFLRSREIRWSTSDDQSRLILEPYLEMLCEKLLIVPEFTIVIFMAHERPLFLFWLTNFCIFEGMCLADFGFVKSELEAQFF